MRASNGQADDLLPAHHTARRGVATRECAAHRPVKRLMAFVLAVLAVVPGVGAALARADDGGPPAPPKAMEVFRRISPWCRSWSVPEVDAAGEASSELGAGVFVQVRIEGTAVRAGEMAVGRADDALLRRVVQSAVTQLDGKDLVPRDALRDEALARLGPLMVLSLELAGDLTPIEPEVEEDFDRMLSPGLDGVAVRLGSRIEAVSPGQMLAVGQRPIEGARTAVSRLMGAAAAALDPPSTLRARDGVAYFKFRVAHLAQSDAGKEPLFLTRGARVVSQDEVDSLDELRAFADSLAQSLMRRSVVIERGAAMQGIYQANTAMFSSTRADDVQSALAALALRRYAALLGTKGATSAPRSTALTSAQAMENGIIAAGSVPPTTAALLLIDRPAGDASSEAARDKLMSRVLLAADAKDLAGVQVQPSARGIIALALARTAGHREAARTLVNDLFAAAPVELLVSYMPWLGWSDLALANEVPVEGAEAGAQMPRVDALRAMREMMWSRQITSATASGETFDLIGGVIFDASTGGPLAAAVRLPTWQVARPLVFAATMLRDARLTPPSERGMQIVRLLSGIRFLKQLQIDESSAWVCPEPATAMGAIRAAPWSWRCGPDSTSMTLLAVCETIATLEALAQKPGAVKASEEQPARPAQP